MTESGSIAKGTTQIGEVKRPLAAVSKIVEAKNIVFFSGEEDWIVDMNDPIAAELIRLIKKAKQKTRMYQHKGAYRIRAWLIPEHDADKCKNGSRPFVRQGP